MGNSTHCTPKPVSIVQIQSDSIKVYVKMSETKMRMLTITGINTMSSFLSLHVALCNCLHCTGFSANGALQAKHQNPALVRRCYS